MSHSAKPKTFSRATLAKESGLHPRHITRLAQAGVIPGTKSLSRSHYSRAFPLPDSPDLRQWLEDEKSKKRRARPKINRSGVPIDHGKDNVVPHVGRIEALIRGMERDGTLANADVGQIYMLHRSLLPVVAIHAKLVRRLAGTANEKTFARLMADMETLKGKAG